MDDLVGAIATELNSSYEFKWDLMGVLERLRSYVCDEQTFDEVIKDFVNGKRQKDYQ